MPTPGPFPSEPPRGPEPPEGDARAPTAFPGRPVFVPIGRRAFLCGGLGLALGSFAASLPLAALAGCAAAPYPAPPRPLKFFTPEEHEVLLAVAGRVAPPVPGCLPGRDAGVALAADGLLAQAGPRLQADLRRLLRTFEEWPLLAMSGSRFTRQGAAGQDAYLRAWQHGWLPQQRQGFVALNRLATGLYYMNPATFAQIGFPGPWVGRVDVGLGLDNQGDMAAPVNPHVFARA